MNNKYQIYIDLDGVLADFDSGVAGFKENDDVMWSFVKSKGASFWEDLSFLNNSKELWEHIKPLQPIVLSAHPKASEVGEQMVREVIEGKLAWIENHLGSEFVTSAKIVERSEKKLYAKDNTILIDDYIKNVTEFQEAGGLGIHFNDAKAAIEEVIALKNGIRLL